MAALVTRLQHARRRSELLCADGRELVRQARVLHPAERTVSIDEVRGARGGEEGRGAGPRRPG